VTVFVVTGHVGGTNAWGGRTDAGIPTLPLLDWADLEALVRGGVDVGVHTHTHPRLTALSPAAIGDEMDRCSETLRRRLGVETRYCAYPYGAVDARVAASAASRFAGAMTTEFRPLGAERAPMRLPRLDMFYFRQSGAIERWGSPGFRRRLRWVRFARGVREVLT
jgi:peptidoglycan/xylan/chitin deacetylase (PgdA/CDA1 family)